MITHPVRFGGDVSAEDLVFAFPLAIVAFTALDRHELQTWVTRLDDLGIEHGEIKDAHYGSGLSFRDPDGIALEFFAPPAAR